MYVAKKVTKKNHKIEGRLTPINTENANFFGFFLLYNCSKLKVFRYNAITSLSRSPRGFNEPWKFCSDVWKPSISMKSGLQDISTWDKETHVDRK